MSSFALINIQRKIFKTFQISRYKSKTDYQLLQPSWPSYAILVDFSLCYTQIFWHGTDITYFVMLKWDFTPLKLERGYIKNKWKNTLFWWYDLNFSFHVSYNALNVHYWFLEGEDLQNLYSTFCSLILTESTPERTYIKTHRGDPLIFCGLLVAIETMLKMKLSIKPLFLSVTYKSFWHATIKM